MRESDGWKQASAAITVRPAAHQEEAQGKKALAPPGYAIMRLLCAGAEAEIYLALSSFDKSTVALKVYFPGISPAPEALEQVALCSCDAVLELWEHGYLPGEERYFEISPYYPEGDLEALGGGHRLPEVSCRLVLEQVAAAIARLQQPDTENRIVVHRDIKPANLLIRSLSPLRLVLADFGIATIAAQAETRESARHMTPKYAAPELFLGRITAASDYWSLGITLIELLSGSHPLPGVADSEIAQLHRGGWRPGLDQMPSPWIPLLAGLTDPDPTQRWGGVQLAAWLQETAPEQDQRREESADEAVTAFRDLTSASAIELAARLALCWPRTRDLLDQQEFRRWLQAETNRLGMGNNDLIDPPGHHDDLRVLRLVYRLAPSLRLIWKQWRMRREDLTRYCSNAFGGNAAQLELVEELYRLRVLGELATLTDNRELQHRAASWHKAVVEYRHLKRTMLRLGAPAEKFPDGKAVLASLYLLECEQGHGLKLFDYRIDVKLVFFNPWLEPLLAEGDSPTSAQQLLRSLFLPNCLDRTTNDFKIHHASNATSRRVTGIPGLNMGWNPPTLSLTAEYIDLLMTVGEETLVVGKGVHLRWEVRNALLVHLTGFGLVGSSGQRPDHRMAASALPQFVDDCPCQNHNAAWFTVTRSTVFRLRAVNATGVASMSLPVIEGPVHELAPQCPLEVEPPELPVAPDLVVASQHFFEGPVTFPVPPLAVPVSGQQNLLPPARLEVPRFGKRDVWPESYAGIDTLLGWLPKKRRRIP